MKFLISNDDGVHAPGLLALYQALSRIGEVVVVAPEREQSGSASALHLTQPLYAQKLDSGFIAVSGSPADCIYLALHELYAATGFDCVITGINSGANLGQDVMYSGTFGAALTAQSFGVPAIATSLTGGSMDSNNQDQIRSYQMAAEQIVKLITDTDLLATIKGLSYHVLNVNIPDVADSAAIKGRKITSLGYRKIAKPVHQIVDPRGRNAYWLCLRKSQCLPSEPALGAAVIASAMTTDKSSANKQCFDQQQIINNDTDVQAIADGFISISPVKLPHTPTAALDKLSALTL